jgi:hypothetical protein
LIVLVVRVAAARQGLTATPHSLLTGHAAPDFTVRIWMWESVARQSMRLATLRGHPASINIGDSWRDACRAEESALEAAYQRCQSRRLAFFRVAYTDTKHNDVEFLRRYQVIFPSGPDADGLIAINAINDGVSGVPETVHY